MCLLKREERLLIQAIERNHAILQYESEIETLNKRLVQVRERLQILYLDRHFLDRKKK